MTLGTTTTPAFVLHIEYMNEMQRLRAEIKRLTKAHDTEVTELTEALKDSEEAKESWKKQWLRVCFEKHDLTERVGELETAFDHVVKENEALKSALLRRLVL